MKRPIRRIAQRAEDPKLEQTLRRIQSNLGFVLAICILALLMVGGQAGTDQRLAQTALPLEGSMSPWSALSAIFALIVLNGLYVAAETAIEELKPLHLKLFREMNPKSAEKIQELLDHQVRYANATSLGSQVSRLLIVIACFMLAPYVAAMFQWEPNLPFLVLATLIVACPVGIVNLVAGEMIPKSFAALHPPRIALILYRFVRASALVFALPLKLVTATGNLFTARFGGRATLTMINQAEEEIKTMVETAEESGEIEQEERELLHSVFEFTDTIAREVMTPRVDLDALPVRSDPTEVMRLIQESGHSRIPLYEETDDQIVGIIHAKDLLMAIVNGKAPNLRTLMRPVLFIPESKNLHELLKELRLHRTQMAIVQDEFGGTAGIVTIEDIVEELVGDIVDEYDVEEPDVQQVEGAWLVDGRAHLDDVNDEIGSNFESEDYDTIGGYVFGAFGRQPNLEDSIEADGFRFVVADTDGRRISRLRIEPIPNGSVEDAAETAAN